MLISQLRVSLFVDLKFWKQTLVQSLETAHTTTNSVVAIFFFLAVEI